MSKGEKRTLTVISVLAIVGAVLVTQRWMGMRFSGLLLIGSPAVLDGLQGLPICPVVRLHGYSTTDVLQGRHLVAQAVIGKGRQIVPPGVPLLGRI